MSTDALAALRGLRIGCVKYLNSRPLIHACPEPVHFAHPAELADGLRAGALEAGLIPVFEALRIPNLVAADDVAIACAGPVYSVILAYQGALEKIAHISLDPASRTSAHLVQIILAEFYGLHPRYDQEPAPAQLLIGTQAIDFRRKQGAAWQYLDLGAAWKAHTGLPFVFALWMLRADLDPTVATAFRVLKTRGRAALEEICATESDPAFARRYLTENIRFDLGPDEKRAIALFRDLLIKHALLPLETVLPHFI